MSQTVEVISTKKPQGIQTVGIEEKVVKMTTKFKNNLSSEGIGGPNDSDDLQEDFRSLGYSEEEAREAVSNVHKYDML